MFENPSNPYFELIMIISSNRKHSLWWERIYNSWNVTENPKVLLFGCGDEEKVNGPYIVLACSGNIPNSAVMRSWVLQNFNFHFLAEVRDDMIFRKNYFYQWYRNDIKPLAQTHKVYGGFFYENETISDGNKYPYLATNAGTFQT